jgi:hypothetical protein
MYSADRAAEAAVEAAEAEIPAAAAAGSPGPGAAAGAGTGTGAGAAGANVAVPRLRSLSLSGSSGVVSRYRNVLLVPLLVRALAPYRVTSVSSGENHCVAVTSSRRVFTWGLNSGNQCGHGYVMSEVASPTAVHAWRGARSVACGAGHTMVHSA